MSWTEKPPRTPAENLNSLQNQNVCLKPLTSNETLQRLLHPDSRRPIRSASSVAVAMVTSASVTTVTPQRTQYNLDILVLPRLHSGNHNDLLFSSTPPFTCLFPFFISASLSAALPRRMRRVRDRCQDNHSNPVRK